MRLPFLISFTGIGFLFFASCKQQEKTTEPPIDQKKVESFFPERANSIVLDHLYVVLDSTSYSAFLSDAFIREFYAGIDLGMPEFEPFNGSATSVYLRGRKEYIEILGPNNVFKEPVGQNGIGFLLKNDNGFSLENTPVLKEKGSRFLTGADTVSLRLNGKQITWYKAFYTPDRRPISIPGMRITIPGF